MAKSPLKIKNKTRYSTRDLRRFFTAGLRALGASELKTIDVAYSRGARVHGRARYPSPDIWSSNSQGLFIWMTLPARASFLKLLELAQVFEHEIGHTLGLRHREMQSWWTLGCPWAEGLTIRHLDAPIQRAVPAPERREARARAHIARLETQLVRTQRLLRKWRAKVRYYDKRNERIAAAPKKP